MKAVIDFDDLCDTNDPWDALSKLKERDANFKVTLFAIPTRCSDTLLNKYSAVRDWVSLGIHGWSHARHECLAWTSEETADKIERCFSAYPFWSRIFKAPNWETCDEVYAGLRSSNMIAADHIRNIEIIPVGHPAYIYNQRIRGDNFKRLHGHIQPWAGTGLTENPDESGINPSYVLPIGTEYAFASDAAVPHQGVG